MLHSRLCPSLGKEPSDQTANSIVLTIWAVIEDCDQVLSGFHGLADGEIAANAPDSSDFDDRS